jgi:hypothetical protein
MIVADREMAARVAELRRRAEEAARLHRDHEAAKLAHRARILTEALVRRSAWVGRGIW